MNSEYWLQRWKAGKIGFHATEVNSQLQNFWPSLGLNSETPVLVPFCGKTLDMVWLRSRGHPIIGVEVSEIACRQFFEEQHLEPETYSIPGFKIFEAGGYRLFSGDFFKFPKEQLPFWFHTFDRASLVSLPPHLQKKYAAHMLRLTPARTTMLLIALSYPERQMSGPPFSVDAGQVRALYNDGFHIEQLAFVERIDELPKFKQRGLTEIQECSYKLVKLP